MNIMKANGKNALQMTGAVFAAVCVALLASTAQASDPAPQVVVNYSDLNLATRGGVAVLYHRIQSAAITVCGSVDPRELARAAALKACTHQAIEEAVSRINLPLLTSQYVAASGSVPQQQDMASLR
jgi:UrcA family protein